MLGKKLGLGVLAVLALFWINGCGGKSKPISVAVTASATTVDGTDTVTFSATVTNDKNSDGVTWTLSGPGTLSGQSTSSVTYTAPAATSSTQTATITATSVAESTETSSATITVAAQPTITTTGTALDASVGASYSVQLAGSGGITPYTWAVTGGSLPPCLTLSSSGLITGTVTSSCAGSFDTTFTMTDSGAPNKLTASTSVSIVITPAPAITFNGSMPATAIFGTAYSGSASATGGFGVLTYTISSGSLPGGLNLTSTSGAVAGTPTAGGTFNFTVKAADLFGDSATHSYQIVVSYPTLSINSPTTLPAGYAGTAYTQTLAATGGSGTGYTWSVNSGASALTAVGLSLSSGGILSGSAPIAGTASFGVQVKDSAGNTATATLSVTIDAGVSITTASPLPVGYAGTAYSQTFAATGGSGTGYTWTVTSGGSALTAVGLSLSSAGVLSGATPVAGSATFTVKVTDSVGNSAHANFMVTIKTGLAITTASPLPIGYAGVAYSQTFAATGGTGTGQTWSVTSGASSLTAVGLTLSSGGVLSGATPIAGAATFGVQVKDSAGNIGTGNFSVTINPALTITSPATLPVGYSGLAYSQTLTASGGSGTGYTWTVTSGAGELTSVALALSSGGVLSGAAPVAGTASFGVQVKDSAGNTATATLSVSIDVGITITTATTLPSGYSGTAYSASLAATGGSGTGYTWTVTSGASALTTVGLSLSSGGVLSGTTPVAGSATFGVQVKDSAGNKATATFSVTIKAGLSITTTSPLPVGYAGVAYSQTFAATGGTGTGQTWSVTSGASSLTAVGLGLSSGGVLSGTTPIAGSASFGVQVKDSAGNVATGTFTVTINSALKVTTTSPLPNGFAGTAYSDTLAASGGSGTGYTWTVTSGGTELTAVALALSSGGVLSGTTPVAGTATFGVQVKDSAGNTATASLTVTVGTGLTITSSSPLPVGYAGTAYSDTLTAAGGSGSGRTWSVTSGASSLTAVGLSLSSTGVLSGTTPVAGTATFTAKVVDSANNSATATLSVTISPGITITTTSPLPVGYAGVAYSQTFAATGGTGTGQTWSVTSGASSLTAVGLTLSSGGILSGTTPIAGTASFGVQVKDSAGNVATGTFSVTINSALTITTTSPLPNGFAGTAYSDTLAASGGSGTGYTWTVTSGASELTAVALALSSGGVLSGTTPVAGSATFGVQVKDSAGNTATASLTVTIGTGLTITTTNPLPVGYAGTAYSDTLTAAGGSGSGRTWSVTSGASSLTAVGLSLSSTGVLSGATPVAGTATFTAKVVDSANNSATATLSVTISPGITITTTSPLPVGYAGVAYSQTFAATGGTGTGQTWSVTSGASSLTAVGLSLSSGGVLSGTTPIAGSASFGVQVKDSAGNVATGTFSVTINSALTITTTSPLPNGFAGTAYSDTLAASGGSGTGYTWTVTSGGTELTAVALALSSGGVLSGTTPVAGTATFGVQVKDSVGNTATASLTITIGTGLTITSGNPLPVGYAGTAYSDTLTAAGGSGSGRTWSVTSGASSLSAVGLSLSSTGVLSGTTPVAGTATFTAKVVDSANNSATATLNVTIDPGLTITTGSPLPNGYVGTNYSDQFTAAGGTGTGQSWTVTSGSSGLSALGLSMSGAGALTGTGSSLVSGTTTFGVQVKDSGNNVATGTFQVSIDAGLTITSPSTLPGAIVGSSYTYDFGASGGSGSGYTWTLTSGSSQLAAIGLSFSGGVLSGSSPTAGGATFGVKVTDSANNTASGTFSVSVTTGSQISGQIMLPTNCNAPSPLPTFTVSINTTPVQTTTTDSNGNYSFSTVPNGTYTITPSITGASSVFYPATLTGVTINNSAVSGENFEAQVGYTVTGTINYSGTATGPIYISLQNTQCGGSGGPGTTINAAGSFTIQGVAPGTYSIYAWMDTIGQGLQNGNDPSGTGGANVVVSDANSSSNFDTLVDPTAPTLSGLAGPSLSSVEPTNDGVAIYYNPIQNSNSVEEVTTYTVEWSTSSSFPSGSTSSMNFGAIGKNADVWILNNTSTRSSTSFVNGTAYYFRARGNIGTSNNTEWAVFGSPTSVTVGANTTGSTVTGTVTIPSGVTINAGAPLYVGLYSQGNNGATVYASEITSPVVGANNFSVVVPNGSYGLFAIIDQNNDGLIDAGDVTNVRGNTNQEVTVAGNTSGQDVTLSAAASTATVQTQYSTYTNNGLTTGQYNLSFQVREGDKLPVAVELASGPNLALPVNMGNYCQDCGNEKFNYNVQLLPGLVPTTSQSYSLDVTYSDGTSNTVTAPITGVLGSAQLATLISPTTSSSTNTPSFDWSYPANASDYLYQFQLCCNGNNSIWQIPDNNSNANGFTSSQLTPPLVWNDDPTESGNAPSPATLTDATSYNWQIQTMDANGNSAQANATFIAVPGPLTLPTPNPSSLPSATVNTNYEGSITVTGGVPPYNWSVAGLPEGLGWSSGGNNNNTVFIGGTPNTVTTISFQVSVTDSTSASAGPVTYTITVNNEAAVSLPAASTNPLGPGVVNYVYGSGLLASGGSGNYTFVVNGTTIPTSGTYTAATNSDGLTFSNNGNNALAISGTPTSAETVSLAVEAIDSNNTSDNTTVTYSVPVTTGPNGANNANLKGTYTCLTHGYNDADGSKWGSVSNVVLDGNGNVTSGVFDSNGVDYTAEKQGTIAGTYSVGSDNNGLATVNSTVTSGGTGTSTNIWAFSATSSTSPASEFRMVIVDDTGTAPSGIHGQADCMLDTTSAFASSTISGKNFIFDDGGADSGGRPHVNAGRFDASGGAVTAGYTDFAKGGETTFTSASFTGGSYTAPSSTTGRYTLTLTTSGGSLTFAVYIINSAKAFLISTEAGDGIEEGHVFTQALSSFSDANLSGNFVLYSQAYEFGNTDSPDAVTGLNSKLSEATGSGSGSVTINETYKDDNGSYSASTADGTVTATVDSSNPGRVTVIPDVGKTSVFYLADTNAGVEIGIGGGTASLESGFIEDQTQTTFTDAALAGNYMLGALPDEAAGEEDPAGQLDISNAGTLAFDISEGGQYVFEYDKAVDDTYSFDSTATGTGTFLIPASSTFFPGASCAVITSTRAVCTYQIEPYGGILVLQK